MVDAPSAVRPLDPAIPSAIRAEPVQFRLARPLKLSTDIAGIGGAVTFKTAIRQSIPVRSQTALRHPGAEATP
ncbi:hypothetical protein TBR22_A27110 [Luteitalea sp. TBR-22]|nr:hypothetical protein TBR22_A27110 [Luteitalea sp. TBR-22]